MSNKKITINSCAEIYWRLFESFCLVLYDINEIERRNRLIMKILLVIHPHNLIKRPFGQDGNFLCLMMLDVI